MAYSTANMKRNSNKACPFYKELAARSGERIPADARFSATVQTGHGVHPAFYLIGIASFPGVK
jgi:hypothetical protein